MLFLPKYFLDISLRLKKINPSVAVKVKENGYIIAGGTDLLLQDPEKAEEQNSNLVYGASDFRKIKFENGRCYLGSATTVSDLKESKEFAKFFPKMGQYLDLMASLPIRNMATVGGNIANGSPIGDLSVMLMALDAILIMDLKGKSREVRLADFFQGYKKTNRDPEEFIQWIYFDLPDNNTHFSFEKISKRVHLDMATVNSAMRLVLDGDTIKKVSITIGGLGPTIRLLDKTCTHLVGKKINNETFKAANQIAQGEITPRSRAEYKRALVRQQLFIHLMNFSPKTISLEALR